MSAQQPHQFAEGTLTDLSAGKQRSLRALEWLNFFVADVQTGLGPFLAAYLAASGWSPARLGVFLTFGGLAPIALQIPAGGLVDAVRSKRGLAGTAIAAGTGKLASSVGRRPLLLLGFGALVVRGGLYTIVRGDAALIAVQLLDGVANVIFGVVSALVIADRTRGTGRFNLAQGALASCIGVGAALSTTYGGFLIQQFGFDASFLGLAAVGLIAFLVLLFFFPETRNPLQSALKEPTATL